MDQDHENPPTGKDQFARPPLSDAEWVGLLRADGEDDNLLFPCCAEISHLRDAIGMVLRSPVWSAAFLQSFDEINNSSHEFPREDFVALWKLVDFYRPVKNKSK
jgi:hypothetical protein